MDNGLRLSGLATGLDTASLITRLMQIERRPITMLQNAQRLTESRIDLYRQLNTKLVSLQRAAEKVAGTSFSYSAPSGTGTPTASVSNSSILLATAFANAVDGLYSVNVTSLAKAQITGGGAFTSPISGSSVSDPSIFGAVVGAGAPAGSYAIDILNLASAQITGGGAFASPAGTAASASVADTSVFTATATPAASAGTHTVDVLSLAQTQEISGGAFSSPALTVAVGDPTVLGATASPGAASGTYNVTVNSLFQDHSLTGTGFSNITNATKGTITVTNSTTGASSNIFMAKNDTLADAISKINATTGTTGMSAADGGGYLILTGTNGDTYALSGNSSTLNRMGLGAPTTVTGQKASISINGGAAITQASNTFTTAIAGVTINATAVGTTTLDVTDQSGSIRFTNQSTGTFTDVAIGLNATINDVANAINAAGTGMTASISGGQLVLTGDNVGDNFTVADTPGTDGLAARLGIDSATYATRTGSLASVSIDGGAAVTSATNTFTDADTGLTGITINAASVGSSTLTVTSSAGSVRFTNQSTGTFTDVAIAGNATAGDVVNAINAAGTGMTASLSGGLITLTGNTNGVGFTIDDTAGGSTLADSLGIGSAAYTTQTAQQARMTVDGGAVITSNTNTFTNPIANVTISANAVGSGTLTVGGAAQTLRITNDDTGTFTDLTFASGASVNDVAADINAANTGMTASVSGGKLVLTGTSTGTSFTVADAGGGDAFAQSLGIDSATRTTQAASLASISVDGGAAITSTSNTFTSPITGVDLTVTSTGTTNVTVSTSTPSTTVASDTRDAVRDLVNQFNDLVNMIKQHSTYDTKTRKAGALFKDSLAIEMRTNITRMFTEIVDENSTYRAAQDAGITLQRDGTLSFDQDKFVQALQADGNAVKALFTNEDNVTYSDGTGAPVKQISFGDGATVGDGIATRLAAFVDSMVSSASMYNPIDPGRGTRTIGRLNFSVQSAERTVSDINKRIEAIEERLRTREQVLRNKFMAMEKVVASLQGQGNYMASQFFSLNQRSS